MMSLYHIIILLGIKLFCPEGVKPELLLSFSEVIKEDTISHEGVE